MHGHSGLGFTADTLVARDISLRDGGFHHFGNGILLYMLQDRDAALSIQKRVVVIKGNGESIGGGIVPLLGLLPDIKPGPALGLESLVAGCGCGPGFSGDVLRWQINILPGNRSGVMDLFAQQCMDRHTERLTHCIKAGHL